MQSQSSVKAIKEKADQTVSFLSESQAVPDNHRDEPL